MPTDMFGNFLTPEEEERLRQQHLRMGVLPGFSGGPAVDTFSDIPRSLPAYGPAAGLGPSSYMGAPQGMPTYNQSPSLAAPSLLVDAGASTPTSLFSLPAPYQRYEAPEQKVRYMASRTPMIPTPVTPTPIDPTYGLAATDPNLQGVTPFSMASTTATPAQVQTQTPTPRDMSGIQRARDLARQQAAANQRAGDLASQRQAAANQRAQDLARQQQQQQAAVANQQVANAGTGWLGNMGIYDDLLSKKAVYDKGPGHPTVLKELVKTLAANKQAAQAAASHQAQKAAAQQALKDFYASRAYQEGGAEAPAGLIDVATEVDSFGRMGREAADRASVGMDRSDRSSGPR
jgi:hypothetical protein